jgi:hypothetical protein
MEETNSLDDHPLKSSDQSIETPPEEPYTIFKTSELIIFLTICALTGMISPLTASIYMPALNAIQEVILTKKKSISNTIVTLL